MSEKYWKAVKKTKTKGVYETGGVGGSKQFFFEVGKEYKVDGDPVLCENGFHFYREKDFVFGLDLFGFGNTFFIEIEATGRVISDTEKCVASSIKVLRYIPVKEWKKRIIQKNNSGNLNSGDLNSGDLNSGNLNSGDLNSGNRNSGDGNSGDWNSGNRNSGDLNSGNRNSGDWNSGDGNSGRGNSGDWNSGNRNSGDGNSGRGNSGNWNSGNGYRNFFCTQTRYFLFDIEVGKEVIDKIGNLEAYEWFDLTDKTYHEAWANCPKEKLKFLKSIQEFQTDSAIEKFKEITGINLREVE